MSLSITNLTVRFGGLTAVNNISLEVGDREIVGLIGPNGAGKTTTLNAISGFVKASEGKVVFNGKDITGMTPYEVNAAGIARTFQLVKIFPTLTVLDNVIIGAHAHARGIKEARVQAERVLDEIGLLRLKDVVAGELPLARQKHLELGRAMATQPKLLLLDEMITGLNSEEIEEIIQILKKIMMDHNISIIFIEHIMEAVLKLTSRIVVLDYGKVIADGDAHSVITDPKVIEAYLGGDD